MIYLFISRDLHPSLAIFQMPPGIMEQMVLFYRHKGVRLTRYPPPGIKSIFTSEEDM